MNDIEYLKKYLNPADLEEGIKKLKQGIPVQYIVGNVNFYGYTFEVNENVLIPRFETEELVEKTIGFISNYFEKEINILDIGTGSGCIAITLDKEIKNSKVDALDISTNALEIAKKNNLKNHSNVNFFHSNLFSNANKKYDVIISNPPYIAYDEEIMDIVKNNEPHIALYATNDGLYYYDEILKNVSKYLNDKAIIAFEIGHKQGKKIKDLVKKYLPNTRVLLEQDLQKKDRFIFVFKDK
ncbi:MAG: peptide chain release factor N(5)-glutamine methyltransferase [Firmicutes bacterium]|nr:peptide chain release factor N(5)-glutamine methyltransferase [Bacillota bacterium]